MGFSGFCTRYQTALENFTVTYLYVGDDAPTPFITEVNNESDTTKCPENTVFIYSLPDFKGTRTTFEARNQKYYPELPWGSFKFNLDWNEWEDIIFAYKGYNGTGSKWAWDEEAEYANVNDFLDVGLENPILTEIDFFPANKSVKDAREKLEEALSLLLKLENRKKTRS